MNFNCSKCFSVWTQTVLSRFRWLWFDVTTYAPYALETSYEGSLLLSGAGAGVSSRGAALALSGLLHVARSLTSNARGVFRVLAEHHIEEKENKENRTEGWCLVCCLVRFWLCSRLFGFFKIISLLFF